jgi:hypothetical protein
MLGVVPRLPIGLLSRFALGMSGLHLDSCDRAENDDAECREDAAARFETRVGKHVRQVVNAVVVHWFSSRCGFVAV